MPDETPDWIDDDSMSADETMSRFNALPDVKLTGPAHQPIAIGAGFTDAVVIENSRIEEATPFFTGSRISA